MRARAALVILAVTASLVAGCADQDPTPSSTPFTPPPGPDGEAVQPAAYPPQQLTQERTCGAFAVIDKLARDAIAPTPDPLSPVPRPDGTSIIKYASALQTMDRQGLSTPLNAALNAHAYALTNLGALINHSAPHEDVASMTTVADTTGNTVVALCKAP